MPSPHTRRTPYMLIRSLLGIFLVAFLMRVSPTTASSSLWTIVSSPNLNRDVNVLTGVAALSSSNVWAVGYYRNSSQQYQTLIQHWNGTQWSVVSSPDVGTNWNFLSAVAAISPSDVWAVGKYFDGTAFKTLTEHWNGAKWSVVPSPGAAGDSLNGVAFSSSNDGWAVGSGQGAVTLHWNGSIWSIVANPDESTSGATLTAVVAISTSKAMAVGYIRSGYGSRVALVERWGGASWTIVATPPTSSGSASLYGVAVDTSGVWAVGGQQFDERTLAERWNGGAGSIVSTPDAGSTNDFLLALATLSASDAWAVGQIYNGSQTLIEHWNGTSWSIVSSPSPVGLPILSGVATLSGGTVWAVGGYYPAAGGQEQTLILRTTQG